MTPLSTLINLIRASRGVAHKTDIAPVVGALGLSGQTMIPVGDDTAVIPNPSGGHLLFAIEGFVSDFVEADPWFAGYCGVMVNVSDVAAMGGTAIAVVDALWSVDRPSAMPLLAGLREASAKYGVPIVGGHSNLKAANGQLAAAILGRVDKAITSFDAEPHDVLLVATDLRGRFRDPFPWWDASTIAPGERLRGDIAILAGLASEGLVTAAKDISMAGVIGTAMMLAETSGVGMEIDLDRLPKPAGVKLERWLTAFPSFGFTLSVKPAHVSEVVGRFAARDIACAAVGTVTTDHCVTLIQGNERALAWDFTHPFIGCTASIGRHARELSHA